MVAVRQFTRKILNARYSVASWLWIIVSTCAATIMLLAIFQQSNEPEVVEFLSKLPLNGYLWSGGLVFTGLLKMFGMAFHKDRAVWWGSLVAFCLWVFGLLTFIFVGNAATVILLILPIMVFNAYLFLSVAIRENDQA